MPLAKKSPFDSDSAQLDGLPLSDELQPDHQAPGPATPEKAMPEGTSALGRSFKGSKTRGYSSTDLNAHMRYALDCSIV